MPWFDVVCITSIAFAALFGLNSVTLAQDLSTLPLYKSDGIHDRGLSSTTSRSSITDQTQAQSLPMSCSTSHGSDPEERLKYCSPQTNNQVQTLSHTSAVTTLLSTTGGFPTPLDSPDELPITKLLYPSSTIKGTSSTAKTTNPTPATTTNLATEFRSTIPWSTFPTIPYYSPTTYYSFDISGNPFLQRQTYYISASKTYSIPTTYRSLPTTVPTQGPLVLTGGLAPGVGDNGLVTDYSAFESGE
ncbi:MAG: hypothetical protein Q9179_004377, partial [Wetmoreana sp. 5 TL-2023]